MEKVLRKRAWRDLKENKFRYFALAFLIIISMYLVISLVGAADTIVDGTTKQAKKHKLEDGQFQVFVPLTTKQKENFTKKGLTVEETVDSGVALRKRRGVPLGNDERMVRREGEQRGEERFV